MNFTKVSNLENKLELRVDDYISKKQYFQDSAIIGWVFVKEGEVVSLHHLYLEEKDLGDNKVERIEFISFEWKEDLQTELDKIRLEAKLQGVLEEFAAELKEKFDITL